MNRSYIFWMVLAGLLTLPIVVILLVAMPFLFSVIESSYNISIKDFNDAAEDTLPYVYVGIAGIAVGILGVLATVAAVFINVEKLNKERRQQDTIKVLLDTRLSDYFQRQVTLRFDHFSPGEDAEVIFADYQANMDTEQSGAIIYLLNYYEFLSAGILQKNLDEDTLRETLRRILCVLVYDMRVIIHDIRVTQGRHKSYQNLVKIYDRWVVREAGNGEWQEGIQLGPIE